MTDCNCENCSRISELEGEIKNLKSMLKSKEIIINGMQQRLNEYSVELLEKIEIENEAALTALKPTLLHK